MSALPRCSHSCALNHRAVLSLLEKSPYVWQKKECTMSDSRLLPRFM
jgi:hypothetical protein